MAYRIWKRELEDTTFAEKCLTAAVEAYRIGRASEGFQEGNSYGSPYRYMENTWADDMEWGAAELYETTGDESYLEDAKRYAELAGSTSWMPHETAGHYDELPLQPERLEFDSPGRCPGLSDSST